VTGAGERVLFVDLSRVSGLCSDNLPANLTPFTFSMFPSLKFPRTIISRLQFYNCDSISRILYLKNEKLKGSILS
jgi:hypothetical protein